MRREREREKAKYPPSKNRASKSISNKEKVITYQIESTLFAITKSHANLVKKASVYIWMERRRFIAQKKGQGKKFSWDKHCRVDPIMRYDKKTHHMLLNNLSMLPHMEILTPNSRKCIELREDQLQLHLVEMTKILYLIL